MSAMTVNKNQSADTWCITMLLNNYALRHLRDMFQVTFILDPLLAESLMHPSAVDHNTGMGCLGIQCLIKQMQLSSTCYFNEMRHF